MSCVASGGAIWTLRLASYTSDSGQAGIARSDRQSPKAAAARRGGRSDRKAKICNAHLPALLRLLVHQSTRPGRPWTFGQGGSRPARPFKHRHDARPLRPLVPPWRRSGRIGSGRKATVGLMRHRRDMQAFFARKTTPLHGLQIRARRFDSGRGLHSSRMASCLCEPEGGCFAKQAGFVIGRMP